MSRFCLDPWTGDPPTFRQGRGWILTHPSLPQLRSRGRGVTLTPAKGQHRLGPVHHASPVENEMKVKVVNGHWGVPGRCLVGDIYYLQCRAAGPRGLTTAPVLSVPRLPAQTIYRSPSSLMMWLQLGQGSAHPSDPHATLTAPQLRSWGRGVTQRSA